MESRIEQLIGDLEEYIESCKPKFMSSTEIIVNKDEIDDRLHDLRRKIPEEITWHRKIINNRDAILADAQNKAKALIEEATVHTNELVSEHEIMRQAYERANGIVDTAANQAQEILDSWDGTEDGFASLAEEHSKDGGSNTNGGLYENVPKGRMVAPFEDWCYEEGRKAGDTGVVYYSGTGAHVMYFVGYGDTPYWHYACENALRSAAQSEWQTQLTDSITAEANAGGMKLVG